MTSWFGYLKVLITRSDLLGPLDFELTRVDCNLILTPYHIISEQISIPIPAAHPYTNTYRKLPRPSQTPPPAYELGWQYNNSIFTISCSHLAQYGLIDSTVTPMNLNLKYLHSYSPELQCLREIIVSSVKYLIDVFKGFSDFLVSDCLHDIKHKKFLRFGIVFMRKNKKLYISLTNCSLEKF